MSDYYDRLRVRAFEEAETRYHKCYNADHERIRPWAEFDHKGFLYWGRLWILLVTDFDDPEMPSNEEMLKEAFEADFDTVLEHMYG